MTPWTPAAFCDCGGGAGAAGGGSWCVNNDDREGAAGLTVLLTVLQRERKVRTWMEKMWGKASIEYQLKKRHLCLKTVRRK